MGDLVTKDGVKPDPEKVQAIQDMPVPSDKTELQRALGLVDFMGNLSARTMVLRQLMADDAKWCWQPEHEQAWRGLQDALSSEPVLQYYDSKKEVCVSSDALKDGLGAVILQKKDAQWMPVAYGSRSLTPVARNYAQIKKSYWEWCLPVRGSTAMCTDESLWQKLTTNHSYQSDRNHCL